MIWVVIAIAVSWLGGFLLGVGVERRRTNEILLSTIDPIVKDIEEINRRRLAQ